MMMTMAMWQYLLIRLRATVITSQEEEVSQGYPASSSNGGSKSDGKRPRY